MQTWKKTIHTLKWVHISTIKKKLIIIFYEINLVELMWGLTVLFILIISLY